MQHRVKKPAGPRACNFIKKRLLHRCFPVKFAKFSRTTILKDICKRLPLYLRYISSWKYIWNTWNSILFIRRFLSYRYETALRWSWRVKFQRKFFLFLTEYFLFLVKISCENFFCFSGSGIYFLWYSRFRKAVSGIRRLNLDVHLYILTKSLFPTTQQHGKPVETNSARADKKLYRSMTYLKQKKSLRRGRNVWQGS